jgi:hypothetical protein
LLIRCETTRSPRYRPPISSTSSPQAPVRACIAGGSGVLSRCRRWRRSRAERRGAGDANLGPLCRRRGARGPRIVVARHGRGAGWGCGRGRRWWRGSRWGRGHGGRHPTGSRLAVAWAWRSGGRRFGCHGRGLLGSTRYKQHSGHHNCRGGYRGEYGRRFRQVPRRSNADPSLLDERGLPGADRGTGRAVSGACGCQHVVESEVVGGVAQAVVECGHRDRLGDRVEWLASIGVGFGAPRIGVVDVGSSVGPRCGARRGRSRIYRPHKGRRQQRFVGGAAKDAAFHQSVDAPHGTNPNRVAARSTHRKSRAACGSLGTHCGVALPRSARPGELPLGCAANAPRPIARGAGPHSRTMLSCSATARPSTSSTTRRYVWRPFIGSGGEIVHSGRCVPL